MALALASCLAGLALVEAALRLFHPKYEHLATAQYIHDPIIGYVRKPNRRGSVPHPDTHERHPLHHNNFGSRQHRDFSAADLEDAVNIGFFGDSFTENTGMEAHFSFTEPLDYLLNLDAGNAIGEREGRSFNVLNFAVEGYSTQQSLLRYENWGPRGALDHVFYVYYRNDLWENQAFELDAGRLKWDAPRSSPVALLGKLHLSYLAVDVAWRLSTQLAGGFNPSLRFADGWWMRPDRGAWTALATATRQGAADPYTLFRQLLRRFKTAAIGDGASFHLVRLPDMSCGIACRRAAKANAQLARLPDDTGFGVAAIVTEEGVETVDLQACFAEFDSAHPDTPWWDSPYRFRRDGHWNEAGNRLAALCLYRYLTPQLGLQGLAEDEAALLRYYAAFETPAPDAHSEPAAAAIRAKYDALRGDAAAYPPSRPAPWTPSPNNLVVRSHFDIHLHAGWLAYVRKNCRPSDFHASFFLHIVPRDLRDLSRHRLPSGFDNLDFDWSLARPLDFNWQGDHPLFQMVPMPSAEHSDRPSDAAVCTIYRKLPRYPIAYIRTGQLVERLAGMQEHLWQRELVLGPMHGGSEDAYPLGEEAGHAP